MKNFLKLIMLSLFLPVGLMANTINFYNGAANGVGVTLICSSTAYFSSSSANVYAARGSTSGPTPVNVGENVHCYAVTQGNDWGSLTQLTDNVAIGFENGQASVAYYGDGSSRNGVLRTCFNPDPLEC